MTITDNPDFILVKSAFPMFGSNIQRLWGGKEFISYIKELLEIAKSGANTGFPKDVHAALERLDSLHASTHHSLMPHVDNNEDFKIVSQNFPAIAEKIHRFWGRKEFGPYMTSLLHDNRGDIRKGFPFETLMALHSLAEQHNEDFRHLVPDVDMWSQSEF
jgi:hypothetical protein